MLSSLMFSLLLVCLVFEQTVGWLTLTWHHTKEKTNVQQCPMLFSWASGLLCVLNHQSSPWYMVVYSERSLTALVLKRSPNNITAQLLLGTNKDFVVSNRIFWQHNQTSMASCKTAVTPLLSNWSYCSLALSHRYDEWGNATQAHHTHSPFKRTSYRQSPQWWASHRIFIMKV